MTRIKAQLFLVGASMSPSLIISHSMTLGSNLAFLTPHAITHPLQWPHARSRPAKLGALAIQQRDHVCVRQGRRGL